MSKIPTAEEFFKKYSELYVFEEGDPQYLIDKEDFEKVMIEFAQIHVEAAIKAVTNNAEIDEFREDEETLLLEINLESALKCYTKELVK